METEIGTKKLASRSRVMREIRSVLVDVARRKTWITYTELVGQLKMRQFEFPRDINELSGMLYDISISEAAEGRGALSSLVRSSTTQPDYLPGKGYFNGLLVDLGYDVSTADKRLIAWVTEVNKVHKAWAP